MKPATWTPAQSGRGEDGAATAETAVVLPVLVVVAAVLAWMVALGVSQVRVVDAARETARALARGEQEALSEQYGRQIAPRGARFQIVRGAQDVTVTVTVSLEGPGGIFAGLAGFEASSTAVARTEP